MATRYQSIRAILDRAAGDSDADYDGNGRFWNLPLTKFLEVRVHGVRMIAPATTPSCCGSNAQDGGDARVSRGEESGLVRGLRGATPFDGSRFPRLPWGGHPVSEDDIDLICSWIDDGCPEEDRMASLSLEGDLQVLDELQEVGRDRVEVVGEAVFDLHAAPEEYAAQRGGLQQRMNIDCMSPSQVDKLRTAFRRLYDLNDWPEDSRNYNNLAQKHQDHCQHGWERFLPWHRIYLYEFEQALQDQCPGVTLPYWDWTMPQYRPRNPEKGWRIPRALQAFLTEASIDYLENEAEPALPQNAARTLRRNMLGEHFYSLQCFFARVAELTNEHYTVDEYRNRFIDALLDANALWYPLRYPGEYNNGPNQGCEQGTINQIIHYHYPKPEDIDEIMRLRTFRDFGGGDIYNDSFGFLDQNPHNTMHIWTGGMNPDFPECHPAAGERVAGTGEARDFDADLSGDRNQGVRVAGRNFHTREDFYTQPQYGDMFSNLTASYDPIFWPVHANVDRLWHAWQQQNPHSLPIDLDSVMTPWGYTIADTLDMSRFGYEYVRSSFLLPVGLETPVSRFVSQPIEVPAEARSFSSAEIRLHRVPQLPRSCFIRVFLNRPGADATTSINDPTYAGYLAIFGHGPCYGGPGHCDPPPRRRRAYDRRPRSHNTPRNHRINVTETARKLLEETSTLTITLVVIGADYRPEDELLRLEGVSLDLLD
ncbi:MAG: tyrosinase family protein [Acidobacteriota bacterium]